MYEEKTMQALLDKLAIDEISKESVAHHILGNP